MGCGVSALPVEPGNDKLKAPTRKAAERAPSRNGGYPAESLGPSPAAVVNSSVPAASSESDVTRRPATASGRPAAGGGPNSNVISGDLYQRHYAKRMRKHKLHRRRLERSIAAENYSENALAQSERLSVRSLSSRASARVGGLSTRVCTPATTDCSGASEHGCDDNEMLAEASPTNRAFNRPCERVPERADSPPMRLQGSGARLSTEAVSKWSESVAAAASTGDPADVEDRPDRSGGSHLADAAEQPTTGDTVPANADEQDSSELGNAREQQSLVNIVAEPGCPAKASLLCETVPLPEPEPGPERAE